METSPFTVKLLLVSELCQFLGIGVIRVNQVILLVNLYMPVGTYSSCV